jgi:hypothetical protein
MHQSLNSVEYNLQYSCLVQTVEDMVDWHQEKSNKNAFRGTQIQHF